MKSRAIFGLTVAGFALVAGGAAAQESLDAGKTGAQLFTQNCALCHKSPRGLAKTGGLFGVESFLQEHYTSSSKTAAAIADYLKSVEPGAPPERKRGAKPKGDDAGKEKAGNKKKKERVKRGEPKPDEAKSGEQKPDEAKPGNAKSRDEKTDANTNVKTDEKKADQDKPPKGAKAAKPKSSKSAKPKPSATNESKPKPDAKSDAKSEDKPAKPESKPKSAKPKSAKPKSTPPSEPKPADESGKSN